MIYGNKVINCLNNYVFSDYFKYEKMLYNTTYKQQLLLVQRFIMVIDGFHDLIQIQTHSVALL